MSDPAEVAVPLTGAWIDGWVSRVRDGLVSHLSAFEGRFGYPPDGNSVDTAAECEERERLDLDAASGDLALLYRHVRRLSLPDVGVGLFVHSARQTVAGLRGDLPTRIAGAVDDSVVVFGSDGGGALFALSRTDGATVYRLPPGRVDGQVYHAAPLAPVEVLAPSLRAFLTYIETYVGDQLPQQT